MSARNIFLIKFKNNNDIEPIYRELDKFMANSKFGIVFEPQNYYDEFLLQLECKDNYFTLTNDKTSLECEEIFNTHDAFEYALTFSKREFERREREFLYEKLSFINEIIKIVFKCENVESIEIYISDQYSVSLDDYKNAITTYNGEFVNSLLKSYEPHRKDNYFGFKTIKFIVRERQGTVLTGAGS